MTERFDILILGSGIAGLSVALAAQGARVAVVSPGTPGADGASAWAQGGIAAALAADDSAELHAIDTLAAGQYLNERRAVASLTRGAAAALSELRTLGVRFDADPAGAPLLGREAAHSRARIVHAGGDATGAAVMAVLTAAARAAAHIEFLQGWNATDLIHDRRGVHGAHLRAHGGEQRPVHAAHTVLATGGLGQLFRYTTNPATAIGQGLSMALAAGATLRDLEFVQFHPTALRVDAGGECSLPLITEALRGAGAILIDDRGQRFMPRHSPRAELAPRDVVARAVWSEQVDGNGVFLDTRAAVGDGIAQRFPTVFRACLARGIDPRAQPIPVTPAAHYHMGGVAVDGNGWTSIPGLYAVGEVACTGVHGANRLASNSLLEGLVFGRSLGRLLARSGASAVTTGCSDTPWAAAQPTQTTAISELRDLLWTSMGLIREGSSMSCALEQLHAIAAQAAGTELGRRARLSAAIVEAGLARERSIGAHYRSDWTLADAAQSPVARLCAQG